jgi:transcriptional regulator with PAS, ATPase and Fis domain
VESELFGYERGAFTGALRQHSGLFENADGGTILLDEIGDMELRLQAKLLQVLQDQEFRRIGGKEPIKVDVRIMAATHRNLECAISERAFREDLYYRLNVINIVLPPLRERKEDVPLLVEHFFAKYCRENEKFLDAEERSMLRFEPEAMQILMDHNWPGNVRELENVIERAVVLASQQTVPVDVLPDYLVQTGGMRIRRDSSGGLAPDASLFEIVADFERRTILEALEASAWSQTEAAESLHIPLSTLNQKIKRLEIQVRRKTERSAGGG